MPALPFIGKREKPLGIEPLGGILKIYSIPQEEAFRLGYAQSRPSTAQRRDYNYQRNISRTMRCFYLPSYTFV
jgi:hypothetical protein